MEKSTKDISADEIDYNDPPFPLTAIDREILATKDDDYHRITWDNLKEIIGILENLKRLPSDLRRYLAWSHNIKRQYGGITPFVIQERLHWTPLTSTPPTFQHSSRIPFEDPRDYAILRNDWPYGFEAGITHLVVWSKTPIEVDRERGDVTEESRRGIEEFVKRTFTGALGADREDRVLWFKNWVSLQSVRGVDHVHVLVRDVDEATIDRWCEGRGL
ncbi:hypothetical protein DOTSEDRAFT_171351 [Dothistroma septosporum NZE10]|uniref:N-acetylglucosamine-induced protein 1 n=1 Tax=Dothistroma septosporum (strain NZE10 / CBS 128990) TaxID=675120 RepID=N1PTM8_DOTSN|nr:hypothetical protein DOTSEDRAFT_171351 [Dothistroma septosporum NZE10]